MLHVLGNRYVFRDGKWRHSDGSLITDKNEQNQVGWQYKVQTREALLATKSGAYEYYVTGLETSNPVVVAYNILERRYQGVPQQLADQIVAERRAEIEKARAEAEAEKVLEQQEKAKVDEAPVDSAAETIEDGVETAEEIEESPEDTLGTQEEEHKNDFELEQLGQQDRHTVDQILNSTEDSMMEYADRIFEIIDNKIATSEKWKDFDTNNMTSELERLGIETNITDIESWIDNLENCE